MSKKTSIIILCLAFMGIITLQNFQPATLQLLFWEVSLFHSVFLLLTFAIGAQLGWTLAKTPTDTEDENPSPSGRGMNIYVGNLATNVSERELKSTFERFGEVTSANIILDRVSGERRGFGFVRMSNADQGQKAIEQLNGSELKGKNLKVNTARHRNISRREGRRPRRS